MLKCLWWQLKITVKLVFHPQEMNQGNQWITRSVWSSCYWYANDGGYGSQLKGCSILDKWYRVEWWKTRNSRCSSCYPKYGWWESYKNRCHYKKCETSQKEKSPRWSKCNIVCKMVKETYVAISISSDLVVLKIYSIVLTFMLPNFGNVINAGKHIKYLIFF